MVMKGNKGKQTCEQMVLINKPGKPKVFSRSRGDTNLEEAIEDTQKYDQHHIIPKRTERMRTECARISLRN